MHKLSLQSVLSPPKGLPALHADVSRHGKKVVNVLQEKLSAANNWISFAEYMQFCLYEPGLGYYSGGLQKFGRDGDFITAPEISPLFGECYADALAEILKQHPDWSILELGPGRGNLAAALLSRLKRLNALPESYQLLEVSGSLKQVQKNTLMDMSQDITLHWLDKPPEDFKGIVIANEVVDALAVERFCVQEGQVEQVGVSIVDGALKWSSRTADDALTQAVQSILDIVVSIDEKNDSALSLSRYYSEVCLQLPYWLESIAHGITEGVMLFSDYGYSQSEYYAPERTAGTLRCYYRQHAHDNPLVLPALQDITAWVNFTQLAESALSLDLDVWGYSTQAHFMLGSGRLQNIDYSALSIEQQVRTNQQIKQLTLPSGMGEQFRFMQLNKNTEVTLAGMRVRDLRYQL